MKDQDDDKTRTHSVLTSGTMIAHYRIVKKIGAGGMGEVYLAEDTKLERRVAIKFLPSHLVANSDVRARFIRESKTLAKLNHPNIVSIHEVSEFNGQPFYVMELVEGESLHHYCHEKPLPVDLIVEYAIQICQGLGEAHRAGITHRDIKAANIVLDRKGRIRLIDFGLAAHSEDEKLTRTGSTLGTVAYMSPEQVSGREIDNRSDLFSLGIVLYELIAGRTPFRRDNEGATLKAIVEDFPEPLTRYKSNVPEKLQDIVMKLLEKDKEIRYQSAEGVIADLKRLTYDSHPTSRIQENRPEPKKHRIVYVAGAVILLVLVAAAWRFFAPEKSVPVSGEGQVPMIAVLPFENLGSAEDEDFADGITYEITSRLAGITGLGVISSRSAMKYKDTDKSLKEIGAELDVDFVVDGTVSWSNAGGMPSVRITPQLVRVADDRPLWSDNYLRDFQEVFAVQADIAAQIVDQLGITLIQKKRDDLEMRPTENAEAYALYLKARSKQREFAGDIREAEVFRDIIDSAVTLDPNFALAVAFQSIAYSWAAFNSHKAEDEKKARESAERALEIEPGLPQGHIALGYYYNLVEENYDRALEEFNHARSELHNDPDLLEAIAYVQWRQGRFGEASRNFLRATELDPLSSQRHRELANCLRYRRAYGEADKAFERAIALEPSNSQNWADRLDLYSSLYSDPDTLESLARQALEHCDTLQLITKVPWLSSLFSHIIGDQFDSYLEKYERDSLRDNTILLKIYHALNDSNRMKIFADTTLVQLKKELKQNPDNSEVFFTVSAIGFAFAVQGDCDSAVEYGQRAIELMPVDVCHW